jgi:hypothetical protein
MTYSGRLNHNYSSNTNQSHDPGGNNGKYLSYILRILLLLTLRHGRDRIKNISIFRKYRAIEKRPDRLERWQDSVRGHQAAERVQLDQQQIVQSTVVCRQTVSNDDGYKLLRILVMAYD